MKQPPVIPFFPLIMKDLSFLYEANDSMVDGMVNVEKLRMMSREVRKVAVMQGTAYDEAAMSEVRTEKKVGIDIFRSCHFVLSLAKIRLSSVMLRYLHSVVVY